MFNGSVYSCRVQYQVHFSEPDNHIVKGSTTAFMCHESGSETIIIKEHTVVVSASFSEPYTIAACLEYLKI